MLGELEFEPEGGWDTGGWDEGPGQAAFTGGAGLFSSVSVGGRRSEVLGAPRLLRWEIRGFLDIRGSMKSP